MNSTEHERNDQHLESGTSSGAAPGGTPYVGPYAQYPRKSAALAGILSGIIPGLGHVYLGYIAQGFTNVAIFAGTIWALTVEISGLEPLFGIFLGFFYIYCIIDAVRRTAALNHYAMIKGTGASMEDMELPHPAGTMFGGIVLIVIGVLVFMEQTLNVSMEWMEDFWPLLAVLGGVYLVIKGRREMQRKN